MSRPRKVKQLPLLPYQPEFFGGLSRSEYVALVTKYRAEWAVYMGARERCRAANRPGVEARRNYAKKFAAYRGIGFKFESFPQFLKCVGPRANAGLSLDRINPFGDYEPGNVRWATKAEQRANQRDSDPDRLNQWLLASYAEAVTG